MSHRTVVAAVVLAVLAAAAPAPAATQIPSASSGLLPSGRHLTPAGAQVYLGNYPTGGAATADGRFLWTVSAGFAANDVRIVDTSTQQVIQTIPVPGASGGIALDSAHRLAYVSGLRGSPWIPSRFGLPGVHGDVVLVYRWSANTGKATFDRLIAVPPPADAPPLQVFPPPRAGLAAGSSAWPAHLAVSAQGGRLLVPLNLADHAAIVDLKQHDRVRYATAGSYPYGAAFVPGGKLGLVTNEAAGTLSLIDLNSARKLKDIAVGAPLSHPEGVLVDQKGRRAYVAIEASDQVAVVDLAERKVERTISVGRSAGLGTMPVALALSPDGKRLFAAESGADEIAVIRTASPWDVIGRVPTAAQPQAVATTPASGRRPARLLWVAAEGMGIGPNPKGTNPVQPFDPIFWAFNPTLPTTDVFVGYQYPPRMVHGRAGLLTLPSDARVRELTPAASRQLVPSRQTPPKNTPLRANGPIRHVFFIVRENRAYDQMLGDVSRGNGDPKLTIFGKAITPNLHALVARFPLLDGVYANSEASIQGHYWTSSASVPDYVSRNWVQQYAGRGRPNDFGSYVVSWPGNGFLFDQAERQKISYFNYGEGFGAGASGVAEDRDRSPAMLAEIRRIAKKSDLGAPLTPGGCFASDMTIGADPNGNEIFDASLPERAPKGATSHVDCCRRRFAQQLAAGKVPAFNYLTLTSDHTRGTETGFRVPRAMVADSDLAVGQLIDTISHSSVWNSSAIFLVEDDSQDGADHVNAHRIPAAVVSPYARRGVVLHTRYDLLSVVRSIELILGMRPLTLNDALAAPMYDAFAPTRVNPEPVSAITPQLDLLQRNTAAAPWAAESAQLQLEKPDRVPQSTLDKILWKSVYGAASEPPPPGPGASREDEAEAEADGD